MSIDKSLKKPAGLVRARNVLKRAERIAQLKSDDLWSDDQGVLGLPKVRVRVLATGKKKKKEKDEDDK